MTRATVLARLVSTGKQLEDGIMTASDIGTIGGFDTSQVLNISNTTDSTGPTTGAIVVDGGIGIAKKLYVHQGFDIGSATGGTGSSIITLRSSLTYPSGLTALETKNLNSDTILGLTLTNSTHSGKIYQIANELVIRDNTNETLRLGSATGLKIPFSIASTSTTTGSLIVSGGTGIAGNTYIGGILNATNTTASTSSTTGGLVISGGLGIAGSINSAGNITAVSLENTPIGSTTANTGRFTSVNIINATGSTSKTSGALIVGGGVGINENLYVGGILNVEGAVTITGNLTVSGTTTTVNTTTLNIADNIITLNSDVTTGSPTQDAGIEVLRGTSATVGIKWNETSDAWEMSDATGAYSKIATNAFSKISVSGQSDVDADTNADTLTLVGSGITITTNATTDTITFTSTGITSVSGTTNQVTASTTSGAVTLSLPQSINTAASVQFGSLGVGTAASGTAGELRCTGDITAYYSASDIRVKENVNNVSGVLDKINNLNLYSFNYINNPNKKMLGLMAQELINQFPELVYETKPFDDSVKLDKIYAVNYSLVSAVLVQAIKELNKKLDNLIGNI